MIFVYVYIIYVGRSIALSSNAAHNHTHTRTHIHLSLSLSPARSLARVGYGRTTRAPGAPLPYVAIKRRFGTRQRCVGIIAAGRRAAHNNLTSPSAAVRRDGGRSGTTDRRYPLVLAPGSKFIRSTGTFIGRTGHCKDRAVKLLPAASAVNWQAPCERVRKR